MLGHDPGASSQNDPGQKRAQDGVADAGPGGCNAVFPTELACVADENDSGEIRSTVGKGCEPGTYRPAAQYKSVDIR